MLCAPGGAGSQNRSRVLTDAQRLFYNAHYEAAAAMVLTLRVPDTDDLASLELRTSALLFQLKRLLERPAKDDALKHCATCPGLMAEFFAEIRRGQTLARSRLKTTRTMTRRCSSSASWI